MTPDEFHKLRFRAAFWLKNAVADQPRLPSAERVHTHDGFRLGAVIEAMNDQAGKGCAIRNVRTWLAA
jgi:hypothetical protein